MDGVALRQSESVVRQALGDRKLVQPADKAGFLTWRYSPTSSVVFNPQHQVEAIAGTLLKDGSKTVWGRPQSDLAAVAKTLPDPVVQYTFTSLVSGLNRAELCHAAAGDVLFLGGDRVMLAYLCTPAFSHHLLGEFQNVQPAIR
jgi:hypothetical protein